MGSINFDMIPCSHGERSETFIPILPDVIIFEILLLLPGDILYNVMRYVCRNWYAIIEHPLFVSRHLMVSPTTLLMRFGDYFSEYRLSHGLQLLDPGAECIGFEFELPSTDSKLVRFATYNELLMNGDMVRISTCNGLLLMDSFVYKDLEIIFYIGNPVTRRIMDLPPLSEFMGCDSRYRFSRLAFAASCKAYKVLVTYRDLRFPGNNRYGCSILTVGIDEAWRELNVTHLKEDDIKFFAVSPISTTRIIYWGKQPFSYILALDIESECIKRIPLPCAYENNSYLVPKGKSITFWQANRDLSMEAWVLKDHRTEEWVKLLHIESEPIKSAIERFLLRNKMRSPWPEYFGDEDPLLNYITVQPSGWLENIETIILYTHGRAPGYDTITTFFVFDLKARTCTECEPGPSLVFYRLSPFINSLAWI